MPTTPNRAFHYPDLTYAPAFANDMALLAGDINTDMGALATALTTLETRGTAIDNRAYAIVKNTSSQSLTHAAWTPLAFPSTDDADPLGWHDPATNNSRIYPDRAGLFLVCIQVSMSNYSIYGRGIAVTVGTQGGSSERRCRGATNSLVGSYQSPMMALTEIASGQYVEGTVVAVTDGTSISTEVSVLPTRMSVIHLAT